MAVKYPPDKKATPAKYPPESKLKWPPPNYTPPKPVEEDPSVVEKRHDRQFQFYRHMTTLNTAAMGLCFLLLDKFLTEQNTIGNIRVVFSSFGASLVVSLIAMKILATTTKTNWLERISVSVLDYFAITSFAMGVIFLLNLMGILS